MPNDEAQFFEFGEVAVVHRNDRERQVALAICMPCCLFQIVMPTMLHAGFVDNFAIRQPLAAWLPHIRNDRFHVLAQKEAAIEKRMNEALKLHLEKSLNSFISLSQFFTDPTDIVPILPLSIYVTFQYRCQIDKIPDILFFLQETNIVGVPEFQWAMASVLGSILEEVPSSNMAG